MEEYKFEKILKTNKFDMAVVNARRFAKAVQSAISRLEWEARGYGFINEDYYLDTKAFLENMLSRLEAPAEQENTNKE